MPLAVPVVRRPGSATQAGRRYPPEFRADHASGVLERNLSLDLVSMVSPSRVQDQVASSYKCPRYYIWQAGPGVGPGLLLGRLGSPRTMRATASWDLGYDVTSSCLWPAGAVQVSHTVESDLARPENPQVPPPPIPDLAGNRGGNPRFPIWPGNGESPNPDSPGNRESGSRLLGPAYLDGTDLACSLKTKLFSL